MDFDLCSCISCLFCLYNYEEGDLDADETLGEAEVKGFSTDVFTESALSYLNEYAEGDKSKPFFCYVAFTAPNDPRSPRADYIGNILKKTWCYPVITSLCTHLITATYMEATKTWQAGRVLRK